MGRTWLSPLARAVHDSAVAPMNFAVANCVNRTILGTCFGELVRTYPRVESKICRGTSLSVSETLKKGDVDIAVAGHPWGRLDGWPLSRAPVRLAVSTDLRLQNIARRYEREY